MPGVSGGGNAGAVVIRTTPRHMTIPAWVTGGLAVAAVGTSVGFFIVTRNDFNQLEEQCARENNCDNPMWDPLKDKIDRNAITADILAGAAVVSAAATFVIWWTSGGDIERVPVARALRLQVIPETRGTMVLWERRSVSLPSSAPSERYGCPQCLSVFRAGFARCPLDGAALQGLTGDPLIGHTLAERYIIEELLGEGGMGRVYRARHNRMSRRFAIKVLFGDMAADAKARTRFSREAEAVSRLNHPNVLSVVDFGETDEGLLYLVMDYIEGRELHQLLAQEAPLSPQRVLSLLRQLSRGLAHAHERNLVHRDFKTENVVVTKSGDEELARIVDFGIAAVGEMMEPAQRLTTEGMVLGTPAYMSPEQSTGEEVDERSDLFSLGVMLYEMLCGRLPFDGTAVAIAKAHLASEVPPVAVRVPGLRVDPRLEAVAMRLMAKDPEERFQSARALLAHLDSAYGRADSQEGEDHDATVQVGSDSIPVTSAPSGEQYPIEAFRMTPYGMPELAASGRRARVRDPRVLITGGAILVTLVVVVVAMMWRGRRRAADPQRGGARRGGAAGQRGRAAGHASRRRAGRASAQPRAGAGAPRPRRRASRRRRPSRGRFRLTRRRRSRPTRTKVATRNATRTGTAGQGEAHPRGPASERAVAERREKSRDDSRSKRADKEERKADVEPPRPRPRWRPRRPSRTRPWRPRRRPPSRSSRPRSSSRATRRPATVSSASSPRRARRRWPRCACATRRSRSPTPCAPSRSAATRIAPSSRSPRASTATSAISDRSIRQVRGSP